MLLTTDVIYNYIDKANTILSTCFKNYRPPSIAVKITHAKSYWANIRTVANHSYLIHISSIFNQITSDELFDKRLLSCLLHELIHTMPGCMNHGSTFKKMASKINAEVPEYSITTSTCSRDYGIQEEPIKYKYIIRCKYCGKETKYQRKSFYTQHLDQLVCINCDKSTFELLTL